MTLYPAVSVPFSSLRHEVASLDDQGMHQKSRISDVRAYAAGTTRPVSYIFA
jgi:hypothetical protein